MISSQNLRSTIWGMRFKFRLSELEAAYSAARVQPEREKTQLDEDWRALEQAVKEPLTG